MQRAAVVAALLVSLALAGCSDGGDVEPADTRELDADPADDPAAAPEAPEALVSTMDVGFDGSLGTRFYACEQQATGACQSEQAVPGKTSVYVEQPGATLVAAGLTLRWSATSPATDTLGVGLMRMGTDSVLVEEVEGTSPLTINVTGLDLLLDEDNLVHIYVYNARGFVHEPPLVAYASVDEAFTVEGSLTLQPPA